MGRHELPYWDGAQWTDHVSSTASSPSTPRRHGRVPTTNRLRREDRSEVASSGPACRPPPPAAGTIFTEPVLVVNQKAKLIELNNEYAIFDQHGTQIGAVRQVGQSTAKKVAARSSPTSTSS